MPGCIKQGGGLNLALGPCVCLEKKLEKKLSYLIHTVHLSQLFAKLTGNENVEHQNVLMFHIPSYIFPFLFDFYNRVRILLIKLI